MPIQTIKFLSTGATTKFQPTKYTGTKNLLGVDIQAGQMVCGYAVEIDGQSQCTKWLPRFIFHGLPRVTSITIKRFTKLSSLADGTYHVWTSGMTSAQLTKSGGKYTLERREYAGVDASGNDICKPKVTTPFTTLKEARSLGIRWISETQTQSWSSTPRAKAQPTTTQSTTQTSKEITMPKSKFTQAAAKKATHTMTPEVAAAVAEFKTARTQMKSAFIKRDHEINMLMLSFVMQQHCLLLGAAGTAKSLLTSTFARVTQADYGRKLFHQFTTLEDLFGIVDVQKYVNDGQYERIAGQGIQDKQVVFADEIFKATTVLQSMLTFLEERQYDKNGVLVDVPLQMCVGASNEYPADSSLDALYDRFLMRRWVEYLDNRADRRRLLTMTQSPEDAVTCVLTTEAIDTIRGLAKNVTIPDTVIDALLNVVDTLSAEAIQISDRRLRKVLGILKASAALEGRSTANTSDLVNIIDALWDNHKDRPVVENAVMEQAKDPNIAIAERFVLAAHEQYAKVEHIVNSTPKKDMASIDAVSKVSDALDALLAEMEATFDEALDDADFLTDTGLQEVYDMEYNVTRWAEQAMAAGRRQRRR